MSNAKCDEVDDVVVVEIKFVWQNNFQILLSRISKMTSGLEGLGTLEITRNS